jgi:hypothetical protein
MATGASSAAAAAQNLNEPPLSGLEAMMGLGDLEGEMAGFEMFDTGVP